MVVASTTEKIPITFITALYSNQHIRSTATSAMEVWTSLHCGQYPKWRHNKQDWNVSVGVKDTSTCNVEIGVASSIKDTEPLEKQK